MTNLINFLENAQLNLHRIECWKRVHFVIGNETCSLDAMACTLCLAFHYSITPTKFTNDIVIPILNLKSDHFRIKTENVYVLDKFQVPADLLIFRDYINFGDIPMDAVVEVTLVDFHVLPENMKFLEPFIVCIYDHRPIDKKANFGNCDIHIKPVGSCATLVAMEVFRGRIPCICTVAMLLYSAIIFDTVGFNPEAKKAKELDGLVADKIEQALKLKESRKDYFEELWNARNDISGLTTDDLLIKDLKTNEVIAVPGLPMSVKKFLERPDAEQALHSLCEKKNMELLVLMGLETKDGKVKRDIAFYFPEETILVHLVRQHLVNIHRDTEMEMVHVHNRPNVMYYTQKNTECSRKTILPILKTCEELYIAMNKPPEPEKKGKRGKKLKKSKST